MTPNYELIDGFPKSAYLQAWRWLLEFPLHNFDDYGPQSFSDFAEAMEERSKTERTWGITSEGQLCGIVAYLPYTPRSGTFHGICFSKSVHGTGIARRAVKQILAELFASGVQKISASFFADNQQVHRFLAGLGAVDEGLMRQHTVRGGIPIDMRLTAFFKE